MNKLLTSLRYWLSYAMPLKRQVPSRYSNSLMVRLHQGRKTLDTELANYSYGPLQQVLRYGLRFTDTKPHTPVLVLGMGGGSVIETLRQEHRHTGPITAIELDPAVVELAAAEFGIREDAQLHIICTDAFAWLPTAPTAAYGLIVIDLFIDLTLPKGLATPEFWQEIRRVLQPEGAVLFNTLVQAPLYIKEQEVSLYLLEQGFGVKEVEVEYNRLLVVRD
ncbi:hypothetical protein GCM10027346_21900 [Hymenobacter seoulensis]